MWEKLANLEKQNAPNFDKKYANNKNKYLINVHDRVFKVKRNPDYHYSQKLLNKKQKKSGSVTNRENSVVKKE